MIRALLIAVVALCASQAAAHDDVYVGTIEKVYDGDTPTVTLDLGMGYQVADVALRLMCVDTPEVRGATRERGLEVRDIVRGWLPVGASVSVRIVGRGKYGRPLAWVTPDGWTETVSARLLREGLAVVPSYSAEDCRPD